MSTEYMLKMELLRRNREELTSRRLEIERRIALREATAAEFSAVALQSSKQKWKSLRASAISAKKRNDEIIREVHETQRKVNDVYVRTKQKLWPSDNQLEIEKARYVRKVEELYPAWQEKQQAVRVQTLRELEEKKRAIEKRRYLAKKTFETEQTLDDLIRQTNHEIEFAQNLEKNEAFEREVLRNQSAIQSQRVEESIREHATGARMYMTQQAVEQLTEAHLLQGDVQDKIFETFSPRGAVNAMRQANQSIGFVESKDNNAAHSHRRPQRVQSISIPPLQYDNHHSFEDQEASDCFDPYAHTQLPNAHDPATHTRAWVRSGYPTAEAMGSNQPALVARTNASQPVPIHHHPSCISPTSQPVDLPSTTEATHRSAAAASSHMTSIAPSATSSHQSALGSLNNTTTVRTTSHPLSKVPAESKTNLPYKAPSLGEDSKPEQLPIIEMRAETLPSSFTSIEGEKDTMQPVSGREPVFTQPATSTAKSFDTSQAIVWRDHDGDGTFSIRPDVTTRSERHQPDTEMPSQPPAISSPQATTNNPEPPQPAPPIFQTYKFVELPISGSLTGIPPTIEEEEKEQEERKENRDDEDKICRSFDSLASTNLSPTKSDSARDHLTMQQSSDLSLNIINSYDSNQSSLMDFSVGKLLQTPQKDQFVARVANDSQASAPLPLLRDASPPDHIRDAPSFTELNTSIDAFVAASPDRPSAKSQLQASSRTTSFEKDPKLPSPNVVDRRRGELPHGQADPHGMYIEAKMPIHKAESLVFSSLDSVSELGSPTTNHLGINDSMIGSVSDFGPPLSSKLEDATTKSNAERQVSPPALPMIEDGSDEPEPSLVANLSMPERLKALTALIARVEDGANDGEQVSSSLSSGSSFDTKRELLRMAVSGRKAQINFFGSDVCFELVVELARELGPVLFPSKAFEGIMNDQKMKKVHQNAKEKELDIWKAFAAHIKQLHATKAIPVGTLVDLFMNAFLSHDPNNQRSLRKLREFLLAICGATDNSPSKQTALSSPRQFAQSSIDTFQNRSTASSSFERETPASPQMPSLLQTAFLQASSPPKQAKTYGIASSSFKNKSSSDDVLKSMASSPTKLSQKLLRGGKMGDYSEFEEEDEVNLENLIGSKASATVTMARSGSNSSISKATSSYRAGAGSSAATSRLTGMREDKDDFDADF